MTTTVKTRPDTLIKLFQDYDCVQEHVNQLYEMLSYLHDEKRNGIILHLRESIQGNVFNRPFQYIAIRKIDNVEILPKNLKNDGDPMSDFFITLNHIKSKRKRMSDNERKACKDIKDRNRYIIVAFKVLDDDKTSVLDSSWKCWTGAKEIVTKISSVYDINSVACFKGVNLVPDIFKYFVLIKLKMSANQNDTKLLDFMQKFRMKRMSGYAAVYTKYEIRDIKNLLDLKLDELEDRPKENEKNNVY